MPGHRADADQSGLGADVTQFAVQVVDVDEVLEVGQPELLHRQEAVPAGHQSGGVAQAVEEGDGLRDTADSPVLERSGNLHTAFPPDFPASVVRTSCPGALHRRL